MARNPYIPRKIKQPRFIDLPKSAGILDDHAVRKNLATKEGTIEKVPVDNSDIANKKYVDDNAPDGTEVKSTNTLGDNRLIKGDAGGRKVQHTGISVSDTNDVTGMNDLTMQGDLIVRENAQIDEDFDVQGESKGSRVLITAGNSVNYTGLEKYMKVGSCLINGDKGIPMVRAGSIVGMSVMVDVSSFTGAGTFTYKCYKNGVRVYEGSYTISSTGITTHEITQSRGTTTFVAGDKIKLSGSGWVGYTISDTIITLELQFDT